MSKSPHYNGMEFPEYEFREYPKWVYPKGTGKPGIVVANEDEEVAAMKTGVAPVREADEIKRLIGVADVKGVSVDKTWGVAKLTAAIEAAGFDPALDPSK